MHVVLRYAPTAAFFNLFILFGILMLLLGLLSALGIFSQGQLGETVGTVVATDVIKQTDADDKIYYEAALKYLYRVGGYPYEGKRILATCHREKDAQAKLKAYSNDQQLFIVYDLNDHHLSRLKDAKYQTSAFSLITIGLIFVVGGYGLGWITTSNSPTLGSTGIIWGIAAPLLLTSCLHIWVATMPVNLSSTRVTALFQQDPVLFAIWRSSVFRWLNGCLAGLYLVLAIALLMEGA